MDKYTGSPSNGMSFHWVTGDLHDQLSTKTESNNYKSISPLKISEWLMSQILLYDTYMQGH